MEQDHHPSEELIASLKQGGIAVVRTDTLYGLLACVDNKRAVEDIYSLKQRNSSKPLIVLIASLDQLMLLGITLNAIQKNRIKTYWPGPVSIIFPTHSSQDLHHVHRGQGTIAVRLPDDPYLQELISITGPLVAPSANPEGQEPASSITMAREYFSDRVQYYDNRGEVLEGRASQLIKFSNDNQIEVLRA